MKIGTKFYFSDHAPGLGPTSYQIKKNGVLCLRTFCRAINLDLFQQMYEYHHISAISGIGEP
jgi:hypothetical protein